jgi:hypothetical protein
MNIFQNILRLQSSMMEWVAKHFPWYIRLVAGKHAGEAFRRISEDAKRFREN